MIYTESEIDSLDKFMRSESALTKFYRSLRMEDQKPDPSKEADPFAGIEIDTLDLPDDVKAKLTNAKTSVATLQQEKKTIAEEKKKAEELARSHQARADRNYEILRKHNLNDDPNKPLAGGDDAILADMVKEIKGVIPGITDDAALANAKIQLAMGRRFQDDTFKRVEKGLNPYLGTTSSMYADKLLNEAKLPANDPDSIFAIPEVAKSVKESLDALVAAGNTILPDTVSNLKDMAYGKHVLSLKPEERQKLMEKKETTFNTGGSQFGSGNPSVAMLQQRRQPGQAPVPANAETAAAMAQTLGHMKKGFNLKGDKK
jgi:hypothetical protein